MIKCIQEKPMIRIAILEEDKTKAGAIFSKLGNLISTSGISAELTCCTSLKQAKEKILDDTRYYNILFINYACKELLAVARYIRRKDFYPSIVFVSDQSAKLSSMLRYRPTGIIFDAQDITQLKIAMNHAYSEQLLHHPFFTVKNKDELMNIHYKDISFFESRQRIVRLHTGSKVIEFYAKLGDISSKLPQTDFLRCHQSYIVNINSVMSLNKSDRFFRLASGDTLEISKSYYPEAVSFFERYNNV